MNTTPNPSDTPAGSGSPAGGSPVPAVAPASTTGQSAAEQFIQDQVARARASLRRTQIIGTVAALIVLGYMSFVTGKLLEHLEPKAAAAFVTIFVDNEVRGRANDLAGTLKQKLPELVQQLPEVVMAQIPVYRQELEDRLEQDLRQYCAATAAQMGKHFDLFLEANNAKVRAILNATQDRESIKQLGPDIERTVMEYLEEKSDDGESLKGKLDKTLEALDRVESHLKRLAEANDLTPQEKKTRRVIAILTKAMENPREDPAKEPTVVTEPALPLPSKKSKSAPKAK